MFEQFLSYYTWLGTRYCRISKAPDPFFIFVFSTVNIKSVHYSDWIRTRVLWFQRWPHCQLCHSHFSDLTYICARLFSAFRIRVLVSNQCDQIGRFIRLWAFFQSLCLPKSPTFLGNFVKVSKSFLFLVKSLLGIFYRHLANFYRSHWF